MDNVTHLGLDVHKDSIAVGLLRPTQQVPDHRVVENTPEAVRKLVSRLETTSLIACYEAGPTGYDTYRLLDSLGVRCDIIAPALSRAVPAGASRPIASTHEISPVCTMPASSPRSEFPRAPRRRCAISFGCARTSRMTVAARSSGSRASCCARGAAFRATPRAGAPSSTPGCGRFDDKAAQLAFDHYLQARGARAVQLAAIDSEIEAAVSAPPLAQPVARLRCFRGIDTLSAAIISAEVCDFRRFRDAASFMAFTGLVPSEHSSGARQHRGSITKTGNRHVRRILVEVAWSYRHRPFVGAGLARRSEGQSHDVVAHCYRAQVRLNARYWRPVANRDSRVAVVAVARELAGFVWALMTKVA